MLEFFQGLSVWIQIAIVVIPSLFVAIKYAAFRTPTKKDDKIVAKIVNELAMFTKWMGSLISKKPK